MTQKTQKKQINIEQNYTKYNRESGRKTLLFIGIIITIIVILSLSLLFNLITKPKILTSSTWTPSPSKNLP